jgi:hypothetical protein
MGKQRGEQGKVKGSAQERAVPFIPSPITFDLCCALEHPDLVKVFFRTAEITRPNGPFFSWPDYHSVCFSHLRFLAKN